MRPERTDLKEDEEAAALPCHATKGLNMSLGSGRLPVVMTQETTCPVA